MRYKIYIQILSAPGEGVRNRIKTKVSRFGIYLPKALEKMFLFHVSSFVCKIVSAGKQWGNVVRFPVDFRILCFEYCLMSTLIEEVLVSFKYDNKCSTKSKNHICYWIKRPNCLTGIFNSHVLKDWTLFQF